MIKKIDLYPNLAGIVLSKEIDGVETRGNLVRVLDKTISGLYIVRTAQMEEEAISGKERSFGLKPANSHYIMATDLFDQLDGLGLGDGVMIFNRHWDFPGLRNYEYSSPVCGSGLLTAYLKLNKPDKNLVNFDREYIDLFGEHFGRSTPREEPL